ncbi:MAG: hypothetical protein Q9219_006313 [cf. Caloplaca sp. 3 TL-2023]
MEALASAPYTQRRTYTKSPKSPTPPGATQVQPRRSQRVTRSQSRDISDSNIERKNKHQGRVQPTKSTQDRQRKGTSNIIHGANFVQGLPEIKESPRVIYPEIPQQDTIKEAVNVNQRRNSQLAKSPGGFSTFPGTTARISGAGQDLPNGSAEDMIDALEDLYDASNKIIGLLVPRQISDASIQAIKGRLLDLKSKETRQLRRYTPNFETQRSVYGDNRFINTSNITRAVLETLRIDNSHPASLRMDPILYRANLATLITSLVTQRDGVIEQVTNELDHLFPLPFLQRFATTASAGTTPGSTAFRPSTFEIALDIRTRYFIDSANQLIDEPSFDPDLLLQQVFYKDDSTLNGWNVAGLSSEDINQTKDLKSSIINRLDSIRRAFNEVEFPLVDFEVLERDFSRTRLITALVQWSQLRLQEIEIQLHNLGGADGIIQAIRNTATRDGKNGSVRQEGTTNHQQPTDVNRTDFPKLAAQAKRPIDPAAYSFNSPKAMPLAVARLKERGASRDSPKASGKAILEGIDPKFLLMRWPTVDAVAPTKSVPPEMREAPEVIRTQLARELPSGTSSSWQPPVTQEEELFAASQPGSREYVKQVIETRENLEAESNKENLPLRPEPSQIPNSQPPMQSRAQPGRGRFIDRQENAERMNWDSQESNVMPARHPQPPTSKRTRAEEREEVEDSGSDEEFEEDTRRYTQPRRSAFTRGNRPSGAITSSPNKRSRGLQRREEEVESDDSDNNNAPIPSQAEQYRIVNQYAKQQTARQPKRTQVRTPWSQEETNRLLELIVEHGVSWTLLKNMDNFHEDGALLVTRDQVAVKDKARNIKFDFLK